MVGISRNLESEFIELDGDCKDELDSSEELIQRLENCVILCEKSERYELMLEVIDLSDYIHVRADNFL